MGLGEWLGSNRVCGTSEGRRFVRGTEEGSPSDCARWMSRMMRGAKAEEPGSEEAPAAKMGRRELARKLGGAGWGLFFIWVGVVLLADISPGVALLGVGMIILGEQAARVLLSLKLEGFWFVVGSGFLLAGIWQVAEVRLPLVPVLLVAAGLAVVLASILPRGGPRRIK